MMFLKSIGISMVIVATVIVGVLAVQLFLTLPEIARTITGAVFTFGILVATVYACLWFTDNSFSDYDDYDLEEEMYEQE